jgi:integrase
MPRRRWGEGEVERLPSGSFRVRWNDSGRRVSRTFPTLQLAETFRRGIIGDIARERAGLPVDPRMFPSLEKLATDWIERRKVTHRSWSDDRGRWRLHLAQVFGRLRPAEVDVATIRAFVEGRVKAGTNRDTIRLEVACLSSFFSDLTERPRETGVTANPCRNLPKNLRRLFKSEHDPRFTPYVERLVDVRRIHQAMPELQGIAYAIGACAGLRPGEILALRWDHVRDGERVDVREQAQDGRLAPLKDVDARILQGPFLAPLWPILAAWRLKTGGRGLVFPPELTRTPGRRIGAFTHPKRFKEGLTGAAEACGLPAVMTWHKPWYQATRHTFATHWMRAGHSLGELAMVLGHSSTWVTERYAHIRPGPEREDPWSMDLAAPVGEVVELAPQTPHEARHAKR